MCSRRTHESRLNDFGPEGIRYYEVCSVVANDQIVQSGTLFMVAPQPNNVFEKTQVYLRLQADTPAAQLTQLRQQHQAGNSD